MPIRVLLADDHAIFRQALRKVIERHGFEVVAEAADGHEAVKLYLKLRPDVAVIDISMPLLNGVEAAKEILKRLPEARIVHLTVHVEDQYVAESLRAGVTGYLSKEIAADELVTAIQTVCRGGIYMTSAVSKTVVQLMRASAQAAQDPLSTRELTDRERQVLQLIAEGKNLKEVAGVLGVSRRTAQSHRVKIMNKLGVHDTASLVRYAIAIGLVAREQGPVPLTGTPIIRS